mgnify:FL=1
MSCCPGWKTRCRKGWIAVMPRKFPWPLFIAGLLPLGVQAVDQGLDWNALLHEPVPEQLAQMASEYEHANGVRRDYGRARQLYCASARLGYLPAQIRLAWMYANGLGAPRDLELAGAWLRVAAASGNLTARKYLAFIGDPPRGRQPRCTYESRYDAYAVATIPTVDIASGDASGRMATPSVTDATSMVDVVHHPTRGQIEQWVRRLAPSNGLDAKLVLAIIATESNFQYDARSHKNAHGLMQLIPETAARFGVKNRGNPVQNLHGGMAYLRWLLSYFKGNLALALAGYNAGEGAVQKYGGIPPYAETRAYVKKVIKAYGRKTHPRVKELVGPALNQGIR